MTSFSPTARPIIVDLPAPTTHTEEDYYFELVCSSETDWEKSGSVFLFGESRRIINSTGRSQLEINSLALTDVGVYSCSVTNDAGMDTRSVRLKVRGEGVSLK